MLDHNQLSLDHVLENLPRKEGAPDIGETEYDPELIPYIVALVTQKKLRAVFLRETHTERALREQFLSCVDTPAFWKAMGTLSYQKAYEDVSGNNTVYNIDPYKDKPAIQLSSIKRIMLEGEIPQLITHAAENHARILSSSFLQCTETEVMVFAGRENGGLLAGEMHTDPQYAVSSHQTVHGRRGMGYILEPLTDEQQDLFRRKPHEFRAWLAGGGLPIDVIPTGTTTIFGPNFLHESSPEEQVSVVMSTNRPFELTHEN